MKLENIPWFAICGLFVLLSMFLYTTNASNFTTLLLPSYLTEALVLIVLGLSRMKGYGKEGFLVFLMVLGWLLQQLLQWTQGVWNTGSLAAINPYWLWLILLAEGFGAFLFFTHKQVKYVDSSGSSWPLASIWVLLLFGFSKIVLNWSNPIFQWTTWGVSITLISFGYVLQPKYKQVSIAIILVGVLIAAITALTINGSGLALMP